MSVVPSGVRSALSNDTRFPHTVNDNNAMPFAYGNGPQPITQQPPTGFEVATAYTGSNDNALGPASNEAAINYGVFMDRDAWNDRSTGPEMLTFIRAKTRSAMGTGEVYEALSLSSFNWNLKHDVNFQAEFFQPIAHTLLDTYKLFGVQNGEASYSDLDDAPFVLHHVARRAKFPNIWSSLDSLKTHRGSVRENDELWLLARRYEHETPLQVTKRRNKNSPGALTHYWQLEPYVSSDHVPPMEYLFSGDDWNGGCIYVGWVKGVYGEERARSRKHRMLARNAVCPPAEKDQQWRADYYTLSQNEVFLGLG